MRTIIKVSNVHCTGCSRTIGREIGVIPGVYGLNVDIANKTILVDHTEEVSEEELITILKRIGYPQISPIK